MATAKLGTYSFDTDPDSITWGYGVVTNVENTKGGRVIQILSASVDSLVVSGSFGKGGYAAMREFEQKFISMVQAQQSTGKPVTFSFPPRGWSFKVFLKDFPNVKFDRKTVAPEFKFTLIPEDGATAGLQKIAKSLELSKITDGVNWEMTKFNNYDMDSDGLQSSIDSLTGQFDKYNGVAAATSDTTASMGTDYVSGSDTPTVDIGNGIKFNQKSGVAFTPNGRILA